MDILSVLGVVFGVICICAMLYQLARIAGPILAIAIFCLPLIGGIVAGVLLWKSDHDNLGVLAVIAGILGEVLLVKVMSRSKPSSDSTDYDWKDDKVALYDKDGNLTGYKDRER